MNSEVGGLFIKISVLVRKYDLDYHLYARGNVAPIQCTSYEEKKYE